MNAKLDIGKNILKVGRKTFELKKRYPECHTIKLSEQKFQYVEIPTSNENDFLIERETELNNFSILPGIYSPKSGKVIIAIKNHQPKQATEINANELDFGTDFIELKQIPHNNCNSDIKFRDEHMNEEERKALKLIIEKNKEVLYSERDQLSFTHRIKHKIRTTDDIPIHTKSYKYPQIFETEVQTQIKKNARGRHHKGIYLTVHFTRMGGTKKIRCLGEKEIQISYRL